MTDRQDTSFLPALAKYIAMNKKGRILIFVSALIAVLILAAVIVRIAFFDLLIVYGQSMSPTIRSGDRVIINKHAYQTEKPARGDIVAFDIGDGRILVKRVVGLPGDLIEVRKGVLYRNGKEIADEPYVRFQPASRGRRSYRPRIVEDGYFFVMGDNRALSVDSKDFGPVHHSNFIGKAVFIYFPFRRMGKITSDRVRQETEDSDLWIIL